ncbi:bis-tetraphosphatase protein [Salinisphaera shabanensis E1L3A]|uniref:Bis-tetraphosphatase protein n=1 Tax=Salinisphaera shabanensis E1L3A TaxID=1033802 RepID=U2FNA1_9GAMM|nr:metallophosphoesterase [Salinisphaera shabanensis]ERJ17679.1 bis-tetraphosphatase protein [Salinisphaera shabanensis E1L3A]
MPELIHYFDANTTGRDFVVGDIHGCFYMLDALLERLDFDRARDRLFSVGDLIDRGPDSERAAEFIDAPWFHAIRGNHEQMLLDAVDEGGQVRALWRMNGGEWFEALDAATADALYQRIRTLPMAAGVELADGATAALVHANVIGNSWARTRALLSCSSSDAAELSTLLWDRSRAHVLEGGHATTETVVVDDVDVIYFGHTSMRQATACANTRWLDTGAFMGGALSIAELGVSGEVWSLSSDLDQCRRGWSRV